MNSLPRTAEIVIIGGGVMGVSTAYHLASCGQKNIVLLEKEPFFGLGATGRCAGGIRYQFATEVNVRLSLASLPMFERFETEMGQAVNYRKCGYLFLLTSAEDVQNFRHNVAMQHRLGVETQWLTGEEIRQRFPFMRLDDVIAGTFHPKDGLADPNSTVMGYIQRSQHMGVAMFNNVEVTGIQVRTDRITSVETTEGMISTPVVVNTAGPWGARIGQMAGVPIPVTPLRRQMLTTSPVPEIPPDFPFVIDFAQSLYFHLEGKGLLTGMSNPDEKPGFDQNVDPGFELVNLEAAVRRLPLLEKAGLVSHWAGLYEVTPDAHPIIGRTPVEGFYVCLGFSGHGFMHGPISGKLMSEIILEGEAHTVDVSMLDLARFEENRMIYEYNVV